MAEEWNTQVRTRKRSPPDFRWVVVALLWYCLFQRERCSRSSTPPMAAQTRLARPWARLRARCRRREALGARAERGFTAEHLPPRDQRQRLPPGPPGVGGTGVPRSGPRCSSEALRKLRSQTRAPAGARAVGGESRPSKSSSIPRTRRRRTCQVRASWSRGSRAHLSAPDGETFREPGVRGSGFHRTTAMT